MGGLVATTDEGAGAQADNQKGISRRQLLGGIAAGAVYYSVKDALPGTSGLQAPDPAGNAGDRAGWIGRRGAVRFGVNYLPSEAWWYTWEDWNPRSIRDDLRAIRGLGFDHIRVQCLWPYFGPNPTYVSATAVDHLVQLLDIADEAALDVEVTVLDGYLSGYTFLPAWAQGRNLLTDSSVVASERLLFKSIAQRVARHRRFLGFDLSNEIDNTLGNEPGGVTMDQGDSWATSLLDYCEQLAPGRLHVNGVSQNPWFYGYGFSRRTMASYGAMTAVHFYDFSENATTSPANEAEYMVELAKAYAADPSRLVWLEEFGVSSGAGFGIPPGQLPDFVESYIRNVMTCTNLWGWTLWASHDIRPSLGGFGSLEYGFGMLYDDNTPTPVGQRVSALIREFRSRPTPAAPRSTGLVIPDAMSPTLAAVGQPFVDLITDQHLRPAIVLASRAQDRAYLQARGITELITLGEVSVLDGPSYPSLAKAFNNTGISSDSNVKTASLDGYGDSYSSQALASAGLVAGAGVNAGGLPFIWPDVPPGQPDNLSAGGQVIVLSGVATGARTLGVLGASTNGPASCVATVAYTDGSAASASLGLSDWTLDASQSSPSYGNQVVAKMPYRNCSTCGGKQNIATYVFFAAIAIDPTKNVAKVGFSAPNRGTVNLFALTVG